MADSKDAASKPFSLAGEFPAATGDDWRKLVDAALKGASFARLESRSYDGLILEPLYERAASAHAVPGRAGGTAWTIMQRIDHPDAVAANAQMRDDLQNGATGLMLVFAGSPSAHGYGLDASAATLARALDGVTFNDGIILDIDLAPFVREAPQHVAAAVGQKAAAVANVRFGYDPATAVAMSGKIPPPWGETAPLMARLIRSLADLGFRGPFAVGDGRVIHNAGGSEAQELAFALAAAVGYLRALEDAGMTLEAARDAIYFRLAADADQFLTMAKFRALRKLWAHVEAACGLPSKPVLLTAETAWRMMTRRDSYANVLRTTIAVAAAGLGGADAITALPHTLPLGLPDAFARRVARNMQLVLLEESNLARVADPAVGSGAIEALTTELCTAAWSQFQDIEKAGGLWPALQSGLIQRDVAAVRAERQMAVARGKDVLTGTTVFPDINEAPPEVLGVAPLPPPNPVPAAITTAALPNIRLAEPFEALRDKSDRILARTGARPKIFLGTLGTPADFNARVNFARNFFAAGGIEAVSSPGPDFTSVYRTAGTPLACLCSSDQIYASEAPAAAQALKSAGAKQIYVAGRSRESKAALRAAGVQSFIYEGCDLLATLAAAYDILG